MAVHSWSPIQDLPPGYASLATGRLASLAAVWQEQREHLERQQSIQEFLKRLKRRWAIETGVIENLYTLDRGVTEVLIARGIEAALIPSTATNQDPEYVAALISDQLEAVETLFSFVKSERGLSTSYINELHALLTRNQATTTARDSQGRLMKVPLLRREYKKSPNNPTRPGGEVHEYCPPEQVASEMDALIRLHLQHSEQDVPPEVDAAWLHHRFTQIHPFMDGNGRVARCLATLVFLKAGWFPLAVTRDERESCLDALESADRGDLGPLVRLMERLQRRAFASALSTARVAAAESGVSRTISAARDQIVARLGDVTKEWAHVETTAAALLEAANRRFEEVRNDLQRQIGTLLPGSRFDVNRWSVPREPDLFRYQVVETARALDYFANLAVHHSCLRLKMETGGQAEILLSFHGLGRDFQGVMAASGCFYRSLETEGGREVADLVPLAAEPFVLTWLDHLETLEPHFLEWLESALAAGLETWRRGL